MGFTVGWNQMTKFTLKRSGQFSVKTSGQNHCGTKNPLTIKYTLICECGGDSLDERGFLFDQMKVKAYFDSIKTVSESCEVFAQKASRELFKIILNENGKCELSHMALTLSPDPYEAELTFEWFPDYKLNSAPKPPPARKVDSVPATGRVVYKGREYNVLSKNQKNGAFRLQSDDGVLTFWAKGNLVKEVSSNGSKPADNGYDSKDGQEFGIDEDRWFDMVNGMDSGEYERFKQRLRQDKAKSKVNIEIGDAF